MRHLLPVLHPSDRSAEEQYEAMRYAVGAYEFEMVGRTAPAVRASRRACLDAHDYKSIDDQSPLVSRRVMIAQELSR